MFLAWAEAAELGTLDRRNVMSRVTYVTCVTLLAVSCSAGRTDLHSHDPGSPFIAVIEGVLPNEYIDCGATTAVGIPASSVQEAADASDRHKRVEGCAAAAFEGEKPFVVTRNIYTVNSATVETLVGKANGQVFSLTSVKNVCHGAETTLFGCGPAVYLRPCVAYVQDSPAGRFVACRP
jgi:hypothetical protein